MAYFTNFTIVVSTGEEKPAPSIAEELGIVMRHYRAIVDYYGESAGVPIARKHIGWYSSGLPNSAEFRGVVNLMNDSVAVKDKITEFYSNVICRQ